jgi:hypothetical protein
MWREGIIHVHTHIEVNDNNNNNNNVYAKWRHHYIIKGLEYFSLMQQKPNNNKLIQRCRNFEIILSSWLKILWTF